MKEDTIAQLLKESKLETSEAFTELTLEKLDRKIEQRMRRRLYLLLVSVTMLFLSLASILIYSGFKLETFGLVLNPPKILVMLVLSMIGYFTILHLFNLLRLGNASSLDLEIV